MSTKPSIKRALISTSNKQGLVEFAQQLCRLKVEIIATGGTAQLLIKNHIPIIEVADYTGFPEIMNGRVKTLHPKIHGGILARHGIDDEVLAQHQIPFIDLVVVNLYPFQQTISQPKCTFSQAIEQIDIGGPTLLRAAAKNHQFVTVIVDPNDYPILLDEINQYGCSLAATRKRLANKTFQHTAAYDAAIAQFLKEQLSSPEAKNDLFPKQTSIQLNKQYDLRYGENPHQQAACYRQNSVTTTGSLSAAKLMQGKPLSYNNLIDADAALNCVQSFTTAPACVIVKHATPCGVALGNDLNEAYQKALQTDPTSAFGGIIAVNQTLDEKTIATLINKQFIEVLLAPDYTNTALNLLANKPNIRVLAFGQVTNQRPSLQYHSISGGMLIQQTDQLQIQKTDLHIVTKRQPSIREWDDLLFAWQVVKYVKSNAIVYAKDGATYGIGTGQTSRVFSAKIAIIKAEEAKLPLSGTVMASDAFFPFADGIEIAAAAGITAVIQPGGSKRDSEVIAAANQANLAMVFTGARHFRH